MQQNLADLIKSGENENLDFKQTITSLDKIAKTICSFANTSGGIILVGVKDNRSITGVDPEEEKYMLEQASENYCLPAIPLEFEEIETEEELTVLKVTVKESLEKPHSSINKAGEWQVYIRQRDKSVPAGIHMVKFLKREGYPKEKISLEALSTTEQKIKAYLLVNERITVKNLAAIFNISKRRAQRILLQMVKKGYIRLFEHENEDYFA